MSIKSEVVLNKTQTRKRRFKDIPIILWGLIGLIVILGFVSPNSIIPTHLLDFTRQAAPLIIAGIGQTLVLLIGGLDLSVGAVMILIDVIAAQLMQNDPTKVGFALVVCVAVGILVGFANGIMCAKLRMPSFIVTLGMSILLQGIMLIYCQGAPGGSIPDSFRTLGVGFVGPLPMALFVWVIIAAVVIVILKLFPIGRYIVATGVNERAVYQSGLNPIKIKLFCYMMCGLLSALAGLQIAAYIGTGVLELGVDYQMQSIAVALLGGAAFSGGKGSIPGTILAGLFIVVMLSLIAALNMSAGDQSIVQGIIILAALLINGLKKE
ncbi:MAG: ABC transporter permease [Christensenella sp.]|nr:ABC transporter permease [Christensenella sp.]